MGDWAKSDFGVSQLPETVILVAGTNPSNIQKKILTLFDEVLVHRDIVCQAYIVRKGNKKYVLIFHVYGAALAVDELHVLKDGGCKKLFFVGYAWCRKENARVGDYILPSKTYIMDGFTNILFKKAKWASQNAEMKRQVQEILKKTNAKIHEGNTVSIPSVFRRPAEYKYISKRITSIAHEQELASVLHFSKILGIKAAGTLIISDTKVQHLHAEESKRIRQERLYELIKSIIL
ncbi:hypothetical protein HY485_03395 [Candidatus Woesearchaeota archaeon]|nr:hypothetical protein [Candidatus Woesearchaeota archaeon]